MRIIRWNGPANYGDDLNQYIWPKLLNPKMGAYLPDAAFYGIGSLLGAHMHPASSHYVVFGAGAGYTGHPTFHKPTKVYFVRGPYTAKAMGNVQYITDPGVLMGLIHGRCDTVYPYSFMPRWNSMEVPELTDNAEKAGFHVIDSSGSVEDVTREISETGVLLTEALHGAVVADAMRVPWISIRAQDHSDFKWYDWCGSLDMVWNPIDAVNLGLSWARDYAVPQLSAASVLDDRRHKMLAEIDRFNSEVEREQVF